jgi:putative zinc finger/helix-turn-helix YgiT family protein
MRCALCLGRLVKTMKPIYVCCLGINLTLLNVERSQCVSCKEELFSPKQATEYSHAVKREYKTQTSLSGKDITRIRKKLNLSQAALEKRLGLGSKVIVRWENDKVHLPGPVNALFKILDKKPKVIKFV